jgi:transmembrane sensor
MSPAADTRREALLSAAAEWFQRLREGEPTAEDITAWLAWRGEDIEHERAYREVQELWTLTGDAGVEEWPTEQSQRDDTYTGEISIDAWNAQATGAAGEGDTATRLGRSIQRAPRASSRVRRSLRYPLAIAASLVLALGFLFIHWHPQDLHDAQVFTTQRGQSQQLTLSDGSIVTLGGASRLRLAFQAGRRELFLDEGEAFFRVHHDRSAPFIVHSHGIAVTAVGTAFNVRADATNTVVAVTEGIVDIDASRELSTAMPQISTTPDTLNQPASSILSMRARAGDEVTIDSTQHVAVQPTTATATLGWIDGSLTFFDEPLRVVLARLNRNTNKELVLADPTLGELRFTGTVFKDQVSEWASGLDRVFPVHAIVSPDGSVQIVAADSPLR